MGELKKKLILLGSIGCILFTLVVTTALTQRLARRDTIVVGGKNCTEQHILSEMMAIMLEEHLNLRVIRKFNLDNTSICFHALKAGEIDLYAEYTGTALMALLNAPVPPDREDSLHLVQKRLKEEYGLRALPPFGLHNAYALMMRREDSEALGIASVSDIEPLASSLRIAFDPEFHSRPEKEMLEAAYPKLGLSKPLLMDHALLYTTLLGGEIDVIEGYSTDGFLVDDAIVVLRDDRKSLPAYDAIPIVRQKSVARFPGIEPIITMLHDQISTREIQQLNYEVEKKGADVYTVAKDYLNQKRLFPHDTNRNGSKPTKRLGVGSTTPSLARRSWHLPHNPDTGHPVQAPLAGS